MERDAQLVSQIQSCTACPLHLERSNAVPAMPGKDYEPGGIAFMVAIPRDMDDIHGLPLVPVPSRYGRLTGGLVFEQIITAVGLQRSEVLILNRVRCKPPRNRIQDYPEALANCEPWNVAELTAYDPALVVLMGNYAMRTVFGAQAKITGTRGTFRATSQTFEWGSRTWVSTFDPVAVTQNPQLFQDVVKDIEQAVEVWREGRF